MKGRVICIVAIVLCMGFFATKAYLSGGPVKTIPKPIVRDKAGWYDVARGTTAENLGHMIPAEYDATPFPWGLKSTATLSTEKLTSFTGQITVYDPKDQYSYLELEFVNGILGPDQPPDSQEALSRGTHHLIWKPRGSTIADIAKRLPIGAEMRYFVHFSPDDKVKLPRDAHLLANFTGFITIRDKMPESSFQLLNGKVESQSLTKPGSGGSSFFIEERKEMSWFEQLTNQFKP